MRQLKESLIGRHNARNAKVEDLVYIVQPLNRNANSYLLKTYPGLDYHICSSDMIRFFVLNENEYKSLPEDVVVNSNVRMTTEMSKSDTMEFIGKTNSIMIWKSRKFRTV